MPYKAIALILGTLAVVLGGYYFSLFVMYGFNPDFMEIHQCVEAGGRWDYKMRRCEMIPDTYQPPSLIYQIRNR